MMQIPKPKVQRVFLELQKVLYATTVNDKAVHTTTKNGTP